MRSLKSQKAARKHKRRKPSVLRPNARRTRNHDQRGKDFMAWCKTLPCVRCNRFAYQRWLAGGDFPQAYGYNYESEFAHFDGNAAAKAPNRHGLPLCLVCHRGDSTSHEVLKKRWAAYWGIDVEGSIYKLNEEFERLFPVGDTTITGSGALSGRSPNGGGM